MVAQRGVGRRDDTCMLGVAPCRCLVQDVLALLPHGSNGLAKPQELLLRVPHPLHQDLALPTALAANASHDFGQLWLERLDLTCEARGAAVLLREGRKERKDFFARCTAWWHG
jgi:hypothetical protein